MLSRKEDKQEDNDFSEVKVKFPFLLVGIPLLFGLAVVAVAIFFSVSKKNKIVKEPYFYLNEIPITRLEYNFFFNSVYRDYVMSYSILFDYMGVDSDKPLEDQKYDEERSFRQYFEEGTVQTIKKMHALWDDGHSKDFEADIDGAYEIYITDVKTACDAAGMSLDQYFSKFYGDYADEDNVKSFLLMEFYADQYNEFLIDSLNKSENDTAAYDYIEELKKGYEVIYP